MSDEAAEWQGIDAGEPIIDEITWGRAVNPDLPPGVIALVDSEGRWWRYPLAEFTADGGTVQEWRAP